MQATNITYHWPDLSAVRRQYVVKDDQGRYGIACSCSADTIGAHPIDTQPQISAPAGLALPANAVVITTTVWHLQPDGTYTGTWYDYSGPSRVPSGKLRRLTIVDDLGYIMPDRWADIALAGSDQRGHWDYGAKLGKVGGEPPVKGQKSQEMTVAQAEDYAHEVGEKVTGRAIRHAAKEGYIPGARKSGRDWLIPYEGMNHYLDNRPKRGPKS